MDEIYYIKKIEKANADKAIVKVAYHVQEARKHLNLISTQALADEIGITKQGLQARVNVYKKEVSKNAEQ